MNALYTADLNNVTWRKSSYTTNDGQCVEVGAIPDLSAITVRDSKNPQFPAARFSTIAWSAFLASLDAEVLCPVEGLPVRPQSRQPLPSQKSDLYARDLSAVTWVASPGSAPDNRVEIAYLAQGAVAFRDPIDPAGTVLRYTAAEWDAFLRGVRDGEFSTPSSAHLPLHATV
ncbi:DUF397 domain-containing protein [Streptosporangium sp. NBC_01495]|uniref:DUF397 domain-containing protein n=1 Tax=Streptosporangium sp. NBC_01495 TaxID=2903899 RepID=UPI002E37C08B|nr:DUF397 domain-containing protein [Streptosporangium sp. NBC_01495]